ncbi:MAG TPA: squalene/phytoene synthase family protein [Xanthobacteraceae bacterium]|jgi:phytoene synthase
MRDAYRHCEALVREADHDRFIAVLFAPMEARGHLHALYAFDVELRRVGYVVREALAGEIRLQWWRDALAGEARGDAMANPVAAALIDTVAHCGLPTDALNGLIDARAHDLYGEPFATLADLEASAQRTCGTVFDLAARILDRAVAAGTAAAPAGIAIAIASALETLPREAARGRVTVPLDLLDRHAVAHDSIPAGTATGPLAAALAEFAHRGRERLDEVRRDWAGVSPAARAAFLPLAVTDVLLARAERNADPFQPAGLAPWRRQWCMWRAARRGRL